MEEDKPVRICIYCREPFSGRAPEEHVIARGYGGEKGSREIVCKECNTKRLGPLDERLPRSLAMIRNQLGIRNPKVKGLRAAIEDGDIYELDKDGRVKIQNLQVLIELESGDWHVIEGNDPKEVSEEVFKYLHEHQNLGSRRQFKIRGDPIKAGELQELLKSQADTWEKVGEKRGRKRPRLVGDMGDWGGHHQFRAIAKMAFNFLAHRLGADFALDQQFDDIRKYILKGESPTWADFPCTFDPNKAVYWVIPDDTDRYRGFEEHFINRIRLFCSKKYRNVFATVELFKELQFLVLLSISYDGEDRGLAIVNWPLIPGKHDNDCVTYGQFSAYPTEELLQRLNTPFGYKDLERILNPLLALAFRYRRMAIFCQHMSACLEKLGKKLEDQRLKELSHHYEDSVKAYMIRNP